MAVTWQKLAFYDEVATAFLGLSDTPANYTDAGGKYVKVNAGADALEYGLAAAVASGLATLDAESKVVQDPATSFIKADGSVAFSSNEDMAGNQILNLVGHVVADEAAMNALTPVVGKACWRTDVGHPYVCTSAA